MITVCTVKHLSHKLILKSGEPDEKQEGEAEGDNDQEDEATVEVACLSFSKFFVI